MNANEGDSERRLSPRRWVMMRVLLEDHESVQFGQTINVSDSGLLIERVPELELVRDQHVEVVLQGQLADDEHPVESRTMIVVRVTEDQIALTFL